MCAAEYRLRAALSITSRSDPGRIGWSPPAAAAGLDAAAVSTRPIVASHTACGRLNHRVRCKPDNLLRAVADTGGLAGICCIPSFLGNNGDIVAMLDQVQYAVKLIGADHVAVGTDVAYV